MIERHRELYGRLSRPQAYSLWTELWRAGLVESEPLVTMASGENLAVLCGDISHAEVVLCIANKFDKFWCDVMDVLLQQPMYMCARGETGVPMTDYEGRPLPLPIGHRRGQPLGSGGVPRKLGNRVQYAKKHDPRVILRVQAENPKMPQTKSFDRFALYRVGMTVSEYVAVGGKMEDINHDSKKGFIEVGIP